MRLHEVMLTRVKPSACSVSFYTQWSVSKNGNGSTCLKQPVVASVTRPSSVGPGPATVRGFDMVGHIDDDQRTNN